MSDLLRDEVKYIRDLAKSSYTKDTSCAICSTTTELQFHHYSSLSLLWNKWKKKEGLVIANVQEMLVAREDFKAYHLSEIYRDTVTLCKRCHMDKLHAVYGKAPLLSTAPKQKRWVEKQRIKYEASR